MEGSYFFQVLIIRIFVILFFDFMKTILITGATGFLGHNLIEEIIKISDVKVVAILGRPEDKANALPQSERVVVIPCSALFTTDFGHVDALIHTAFSRGDNLPGLTASITLTERIIELVNKQDIDSVVNISTQGLYKGLRPNEKVSEEGTVEPNTAYGLAKWAVENMLKLGCRKPYTNIRMASLSTNARFLDFFVDCVMKGQNIRVTAPNQYASIMDVSDAVKGILSIIDMPVKERDTVYNLGPGEQYSILEYANTANEIGRQFGFSSVQVIVDDNGQQFAICMDCSKLQSKASWKPVVGMDLMMKRLFEKKTNG